MTDTEIARMRRGGNCSHDVWAVTDVKPPAVGMANDCDDHYVQYFRSRAELDAFISALITAANDAWGGQYTHLQGIPGLRVDPVTGNVGIGGES